MENTWTIWTLSGLMSGDREHDLYAPVKRFGGRDAMREKLEAFKRSRAGQFVQKIQDDRAPNLAILLAWGRSTQSYR